MEGGQAAVGEREDWLPAVETRVGEERDAERTDWHKESMDFVAFRHLGTSPFGLGNESEEEEEGEEILDFDLEEDFERDLVSFLKTAGMASSSSSKVGRLFERPGLRRRNR